MVYFLYWFIYRFLGENELKRSHEQWADLHLWQLVTTWSGIELIEWMKMSECDEREKKIKQTKKLKD